MRKDCLEDLDLSSKVSLTATEISSILNFLFLVVNVGEMTLYMQFSFKTSVAFSSSSFDGILAFSKSFHFPKTCRKPTRKLLDNLC